PLLVSGLVYHGMMGGSVGFVQSLLGACLGFAVLFVFHLMGGVGGGDVKLLAAVGAWLGSQLTFFVFLASALAAGVYALGLILTYGRVRDTWVNLQIIWHRVSAIGRYLGADDRLEAEVSRPDRRQRVIPFAAMVALGLVALLVFSALVDRP